MPEFDNKDDFEAWLKDKPQEVCVALAARSALRCLPQATVLFDQDISRIDPRPFVLACLRSMLISGVAAKMPTPEIKSAALSAARSALSADSAALSADSAARSAFSAARSALSADSAARSAALSADSAARSAARSALSAAFSADSALSAAWAALSTDTDTPNLLQTPGSLFSAPLWPKGAPEEFAARKQAFARHAQTHPEWTFWAKWYDAMWRGAPLDWDLQKAIALLPDADWEAGPERIAERIKEIEADLLNERLPQAEEIAKGGDGLYAVTPLLIAPEALIEGIFRQLDFSLEIALRGHNASGFDDMCVGFKYLDHTRKNCRDDANAIHMNLRLAREIIEGKLASGEYQNEDGLTALVTALERHEVQLRADHPEVRTAHETFVAQRLRELDEERRLAIAGGFKSLQDDSKGRLHDEFGLDAETLESDSGAEAQADAVKRSGGRAMKMSLGERAAEATKAADGHAVNKGTGLLLRLYKLAELIAPLL